jgi:hypothetical protein
MKSNTKKLTKSDTKSNTFPRTSTGLAMRGKPIASALMRISSELTFQFSSLDFYDKKILL